MTDRRPGSGRLARVAPHTFEIERKPHKTMTLDEYNTMPIIGWHEVCRDVDGFGGVGVRFLGLSNIDGQSRLREDEK
jgi:hypothetical protein